MSETLSLVPRYMRGLIAFTFFCLMRLFGRQMFLARIVGGGGGYAMIAACALRGTRCAEAREYLSQRLGSVYISEWVRECCAYALGEE